MRRALGAVVLAALGVCGAGSAAAAEVVRLRVEDTIQPATQRYIERGLEEAAERGAALVVLELDTPGGLLDSTREITTAITGSAVPVVVWVAPAGARAASAGFFILMSADVAAMAPGTNTGAAHPVSGQGQEMPEDVRDKATNDAAAMIRSLASERGRNVDLAVEAVVESSSFTAQEALDDGLIEVIASSLDELLEMLDERQITRFHQAEGGALDLEDATVYEVPPTAAERLLSVLANPNIAYLLMALGMLGIYVEVTHPGGIFPGVVGVIAILLALYSLSVLPVNLAGVALIAFAFVLFLLEVKVTSYGLLSLAGIASFVLGSLMLFDSPIPAMRVSLGVVLPTAVVMAVVMVFLLSRVVRLHRQRTITGREGLVDEVGRAVSALEPTGKVLVHGEYWDARATGGPVAAGARVRVVTVDGRTLTVAAADELTEGAD